MKLKIKLALFCSILIAFSALAPMLIGAETTDEKRALVIGSGGTVNYPDPHESYWHTDINFYMQIVEQLYRTNISDQANNYPLIPVLATSFGTWSGDGLNWTIPLREGIYFTDGLLFNATVAKWNFDRMYNLEELGVSQWGTLLFTSNATDPEADLVKAFETEIVSEYVIKLIWPYPRASAQSLLAFQGFSMLSSDSTTFDEAERFNIVGTGPFIMVGINSDGSRSVVRNDDYWRGPADIPEIRWIYNSDTDALHTGILGGPGIRQYDIIGPGLAEYYDQFREDDTLVFHEGISGQVYFYAGMNTLRIPVAHRKAMAYAFNYTYYLEDVWGGAMDYMYTPVSPGIPGSKVDCDIPTLDIVRARAFLLDSTDPADEAIVLAKGLTTSSTDADWIDVADTTPFGDYNISHSLSTRWTDTGAQMVADFELVGIKITDEPMESAVLTTLVNVPANFHRVDMFLLGWGPDYLDPHNMIYDAFAGPLALNPMNLINNSDFDEWLELLDNASRETDIPTRIAMYEVIQCQIMEEQYDLIPWIHLFNTKEDYLHTSELGNYPVNPMGDAYYWVCTWDPYEAPVPPPEPVIPGYELVALFTVMGTAVVFLARKNRK